MCIRDSNTGAAVKTVTVEVYPYTGAITLDGYLSLKSANHTHSVPQLTVNATTTDSDTSQSGSSHTHGVTYGIKEETLTSPEVVVVAGAEGSEASVGTYNTDQTDVDITTNVTDVGAGNWINVKFTPNKNMRLETNCYVQIFIESKT